MSTLSKPTPVMLFASVLFQKYKITEEKLCSNFEQKFGKGHSAFHPFCPMKNYYSKEMGEVEKLKRVFFFSHQLHQREILVPAKLWAIEQETQCTEGKNRFVNFDVGTLSLENVQLATGKQYSHRVYLRENIYSDLTLMYQHETYVTLPWTYPDYAHPEILNIFNWNRRLLQGFLELASQSN